MASQKVVIMGAAGRDFHNFNTYYRDDPTHEVVAFTATQIPNIDGRAYPAVLAGSLYPDGIPIYPEAELAHLIDRHHVDEVVFSYSDVPHVELMHKASAVLAAGADFRLLGPNHTQVRSVKPLISINAVRTGAGKSPTSRRATDALQKLGYKVVAIRHPMPYGDLAAQAVQRFASVADLERHHCTIEECEEYEPHVTRGVVIYAGVDYERILREAEKEADIILWDGGNNDFSFYRSDLVIVVADPHRPGHELLYHPGETNFRSADVIVINKVDTAAPEAVQQIRNHAYEVNPKAVVIEAAAPILVEDSGAIRGRRVLVVEDGPTLTHGEMAYGAGYVAARRYGGEVVDPRPYAVGSIAKTYEKYRTTGPVLPAMGYGDRQVRELEETIAQTPCDLVLIATPIDLRRVVRIAQPSQRVRYEMQEIGTPTLWEIFREKFGIARAKAHQREAEAVLA